MSSLKVSLAQLGLVTLTAGALASPALADFSPLEQPLESDFFVSAGAGGLVFGDGDVVTNPGGKARTQEEASASLLDKVLDTDKALLIGKNLYQDDALVAGVFGRFVNGKGKILAESPVGVGGYLAYQDLAEDGTGLKLGATIAFDRELGAFADASDLEAVVASAVKDVTASEGALTIATAGEKTASEAVDKAKKSEDLKGTDATKKTEAEKALTKAEEDLVKAKDTLAEAQAADAAAKENKDIADRKLAVTKEKGIVTAKLFESYELVLGEVAGNPLRLTQTATLTASQNLNDKDAAGKKTELALGAAGDVTLSTQIDQLAPSLTVAVEQADFDVKKTALDITAEVGFQATDQIALSVNAGAGREFGTAAEVKDFAFSYGAGLGFQVAEGAKIGLTVDSFNAGKTAAKAATSTEAAVKAEDVTAYAVGLGLDLRF